MLAGHGARHGHHSCRLPADIDTTPVTSAARQAAAGLRDRLSCTYRERIEEIRMSDQPVAVGDSTELSMSSVLDHLDNVLESIPELSLDGVDRLVAQLEPVRSRLESIEEAARWRRWRVDAADQLRSGDSR
jgi:hypothetical protein